MFDYTTRPYEQTDHIQFSHLYTNFLAECCFIGTIVVYIKKDQPYEMES